MVAGLRVQHSDYSTILPPKLTVEIFEMFLCITADDNEDKTDNNTNKPDNKDNDKLSPTGGSTSHYCM